MGSHIMSFHMTWSILMEGGIILMACFIGLYCICVACGLPQLCFRQSSEGKFSVSYPVAVSNRLFNESEIGKDLPCLHCQLIEMGEMACYQEFCPHCGRVPPGRKTREDLYLEYTQGYNRRLAEVNPDAKDVYLL